MNAKASAYSSYLAARRNRRFVVVRVGAPPALVEAGAPGARDEVRAYATRIDEAWKSFWSDDVKPWAEENVGDTEEPTEGESSLGEVLGSDPKKVAEQRRKIALYERIRNARTAFKEYRDEISSFSITGPTPSEAWQTLQTHEDSLNEARGLIAAETKKPLKSNKPAPLEVAGGVKQGVKESLGEFAEGAEKFTKNVAGSILPWVAGAVVGLGAVILLSRK